jgi:hypothetical protein
MRSSLDFFSRPGANRAGQTVKLRLDECPGPTRSGRHSVRTVGWRRIHFIFPVELLLVASGAGTMP